MRWLIRKSLEGALMVALSTSVAEAQPMARTFGELQTLLKTGEYVLVTDPAGREMWGKVAGVSASTLTLVRVLKTDDGARIENTSERRVFAEVDIRLILRTDSTGRRGAVIYPASWDKVDVLPPATDVAILLESGDWRRYQIVQAGPDRLRLLTPSGREEILQKSDVRRVERHGVSDGTGDGIMLGALIGAGTGLGMMSVAYANVCDTCDAPAPGPMFLAAGTFCAGIGALTGWVVDKLHHGKEVVFPTVSPILTGGRKGVALSLRF
jgi:hypothetical protein